MFGDGIPITLEFGRPLPREEDTPLRTFTCKPRPESSLDCLACAIFARQRSEREIRRENPFVDMPPSLSLLLTLTYPIKMPRRTTPLGLGPCSRLGGGSGFHVCVCACARARTHARTHKHTHTNTHTYTHTHTHTHTCTHTQTHNTHTQIKLRKYKDGQHAVS